MNNVVEFDGMGVFGKPFKINYLMRGRIMDKGTLTRAEARMFGLSTYFNGSTCKAGHVSERYVSTGNCIECHRALRANVSLSLNMRIDRLKAEISDIPLRFAKLRKELDAKKIECDEYEISMLTRAKQALLTLEAKLIDDTHDSRVKLDLADFVEVKLALQYKDVSTAQALLLAYCMEFNINAPIKTLWLWDTPRHGTLYKIKCPASRVDEFKAWAKSTYDNETSPPKPINTHQAHEDSVNEILFGPSTSY